MPTSLVTGIAGFLGSHIAGYLLKMGHEVIGLDDLSGGFRKNVPMGATLRLGSIIEPRDVNALFALYKPDYVFHLAAYAAEGLSHHIRAFNYTNNVVGSVNVINAAVKYGVKRLVFTSSAAVYGAKATSVGSTDEEQVPTPIDPYGIAKYAVEMDLKAAREYFDLEYTIFRPHNVYGPGQSLSDGYRNVVGIFLRQALRGEPLTLFGTADKTRQFSYIDDVAPYIARCISLPQAANQIFNIGSDPSYDIQYLAARVSIALEVPLRTAVWPERDEARHVAVAHGKFREIFKPTDHVRLVDGLALMAAWARMQTLREPKAFESIEIEKNLPKSWRGYVH